MPRRGSIVLAGGQSSRMGTAKAWLDFHGEPLLCHVVRQLTLEVVVVVAAPGQVLPELDRRVVRIDDPFPWAGPLVGLEIGLGALLERGCEVAQLAGCDTPGLTAAHVEFMISSLQRSGAEALIPVAHGRRHPLAGAVRVEPAWSRARSQRAAGSMRLQDWAAPWATIEAERLPDPHVLEPCNTPEDWAAWLARTRPARDAQA